MKVSRLVTIITSISALSFLSGCAHNISPYSPSFANINLLQQHAKQSNPIAFGSFTDPKNTKSIACRLEGSEYLPGHITYVEYIKNALQDDLTHVGLYSSAAKTKLNANLDHIDSSAAIANGSWTIQLTFNDNQQKPYTVRSVYNFSTNFVADIACTQVAQAFVPATQKFLQTLYKDRHFVETLNTDN